LAKNASAKSDVDLERSFGGGVLMERRASWGGVEQRGVVAAAVEKTMHGEEDEKSENAPVASSSSSSGEAETAMLTKDCLTVIFSNMSPMSLWRCTLVCRRWRRISLLTWDKGQKDKLVVWLKKQLVDHYLPYRRLSYYDRDYRTLELTLTWPKRPFVLHNVFPPGCDATLVTFVQERLTEVFGLKSLAMCNHTIMSGPETMVQWEGHAVQVRLAAHVIATQEAHLLQDWCRLLEWTPEHEGYLVWGVENHAHWGEKFCTEYLNWNKNAKSFHKDFVGTANALVNRKVALVRSYDALSVGQIMHLVRGELPEAFPSLEEFEAILPQHVIDESKANFDRFMQESQRGKLGIEVPVAPAVSWTTSFFRSLFRSLYSD
jgi:hypothetical protein